MKQYSTFIFDRYTYDPESGILELHYTMDDEIGFVETLRLPVEKSEIRHLKSETLENLLFSLHLIGGASYYKTCCPKAITIRSGQLTPEQAKFWNTVYENGLGEFFYKNDIDFRGLIKFPSVPTPHPLPPDFAKATSGRPTPTPARTIKKILVPVGGGKDSVVSWEKLRAAGCNVTLLRMGKHPMIEKLAETAGLPLLTIDRHLSSLLFELNAQGALNGHVPITAYLSIVSMIVAELHGFDLVALSNERSANEGNIVDFHGMEINHQWSKSLAFETMLQDYLRDVAGTSVGYCSVLRPLSELSIAEAFTKFPQYFGCTTSCNTNWKILSGSRPHDGSARWCGRCPKCAFVFLLFSACLDRATLTTMFGNNLFDDRELLPLYRELLGVEGSKPFECVGTPQESLAAFVLAHRKGEFDNTQIMHWFVKEELSKISDPDVLIAESRAFSTAHAIPSVLARTLGYPVAHAD